MKLPKLPKLPKWRDDTSLDILDYAMVGVLVMFTVLLFFVTPIAGLTAVNLFFFAFLLGRKWEWAYGKKKNGV